MFERGLPNADFFQTIPKLDAESTNTADEIEEFYRPLLTSLSLQDSGQNLKDIWNEYRCTHVQIVALVQERTTQSSSPVWYAHRKGRIIGTKAHYILVKKIRRTLRIRSKE